MTRRSRRLKAAALLLVLSLSPFCLSPKKAQRPNIILITIDALRADHLGTYGYSYPTSPHIDEFAKKAIVFEQAYCTIPKTSASLASLFTGLHPFSHKTRPNRDSLNEKFITLAEALKLRGYLTMAVVDNSNLSKKFNFDQGFDLYITAWDETEKKEVSAPYLTKTILEFLKNPPRQPFFLWAHYIETHAPYFPPSEFVEERPKGRIIADVAKKMVMGHKLFMAERAAEGEILALYDGAVKYVDSEFQKILNLVYEKGYDKDSLVILSSDHGTELGEHNYFFNHGPLTFSSSTRVPLIISWPGEKSRRIKYPVSLMDIYPTILERVGLVPPYEIQGMNLFKKQDQRALFILGTGGTQSIIDENYHLIKMPQYFSAELGLESIYLFDISRDPLEKENLAGRREKLLKVIDKKLTEYFAHQEYTRIKDDEETNIPLSEKELERLRTLGYIR